MVLSRSYNGGHDRVGDAQHGLFLTNGLDTIDASRIPTDLIGHGYLAESKEVIDDVFQLLVRRQGPEKRRLNQENLGPFIYWRLP
jgi:hypothetical protein